MGLIYRRMVCIGRKGRCTVEALFDSGSNHCLMRDDVAARIAPLDELPEPKLYEAAVGSFRAKHFVVADVSLAGRRLTTLFKVVPDLTEEAILGADFLQSWHIRLDPRRRRILVDPRALRLKAVGSRLVGEGPRRRPRKTHVP